MLSKEKPPNLLQPEEFRARSRGYLPHVEVSQHPQMLTYRLHDSLPSTVLANLTDELQHIPKDSREVERRRRIEDYLDNGAGSCSLANILIAQTIQENLLHFDDKRYKLHAWVIMPNHVHVLVTPAKGFFLADIIHTWKSYTAKKANQVLACRGEFWQREYFDRVIRNDQHLKVAVEYIHNNPVKAGLCQSPTEWQFSSARIPFDFDVLAEPRGHI